jgi:predicted alpha/beta hydrolase
VALSNATGFTIQNRQVGIFATWAATDGVRVLTGDFNGDGTTDIALVRQTAGWGTVPVALSNATGFVIQNRPVGDFATWATLTTDLITGDFNGDGTTDIGLVKRFAFREPAWSTVPVALSSATGFTIQNRPVGNFADWASTNTTIRVITGDFNGDRTTDIALVRQTAGWGTVPVALSNATGFTIQNRPVGNFAAWAATSGVRVITGDFNADGATDIALVRQTAGWGTVPVALSNATGFTIQNRWVGDFAAWAATSGVRVLTGDFNGDGAADIGLVRQAAGWGTVPVALSSRPPFGQFQNFTIQNRWVGDFAAWAATSGVRVLTGDFNGDGMTDISLVRQAAGWATVPVALASEPRVRHFRQVRRFNTASLTNEAADRILTDATIVLQAFDGPGDLACPVNMVRNGPVTAFTTGDGSIDSQAEFNTLMGLVGHIKVVNQINWCSTLRPNLIGCAPTPGNSLAVVRFTRRQEGILWAHEFGHNKGLGHRNDDPNAVMNGTIGPTRRRVNAGECLDYQTPSLAIAAGAEMPLDLGSHASEANHLMDVKDFVRQIFIEGVPYDVANKYGSSDVPTLLEMLNDAAQERYWPNIVVVLGIIGDDSVVAPLISFIEADAIERALTDEHYRAKTSALMSLGYVINKTGNQQALNYLKESLDPQIWAVRGVGGRAPFQASTAERNTDLSKHALLGLALSGHPAAAEALRSMKRPAQTSSQQAFQVQMDDLISEALKENQKIANQGLADYYRNAQK